MRLPISCLMLFCAVPALAWDGSPRVVANVTSPPALVATAHDGAFGAYVAWQASAGASTLHLARLDPRGDAHPAWPAGGIAFGGGPAARTALRLLPDEAGGVYALWLQAGTLRLTRVLGDGSIANGWTAAGRLLGALSGAEHRPWVEADGAGGVWLGWFQGARTAQSTPAIRVAHLGPDGQGAGGWPGTPRAIALSPDDDEWVYSASFAPAEDGGAWALVATGRVAEAGVTPGAWRLARLGPTGLAHPSLPPEGVVLGPFEADQIGFAVPRLGIGAVIGDGAGGVFVALGRVSASAGGAWDGNAQIRRLFADGSPHAPPPGPTGMGFWWEQPGGSCPYVPCSWADYSVRLMRDRAGDLVAAATESYTHIGFVLRLRRLSPAGVLADPLGWASGAGVALHPAFGPGFVFSTFDPSGPTHQVYDPEYAYVGYSGTGTGASYREATFSPYLPVYTASDVAPLPDGGVLLVWARSMAPTGLYALRVGASGSPLAAEPGAGPAVSGLRLAGGKDGLRAAWGPGSEGTLVLHDVAGRVLARVPVPPEAGSTVLSARDALAPGVYFARLARRGGMLERARAVLLP